MRQTTEPRKREVRDCAMRERASGGSSGLPRPDDRQPTLLPETVDRGKTGLADRAHLRVDPADQSEQIVVEKDPGRLQNGGDRAVGGGDLTRIA